MSFGWYTSIILGSSSLFQSITVSGFTMALSPDIVLYITLSFLKKLSTPRWAATCAAFSFKWGPSMDVSVVHAWATPKGRFQVFPMEKSSEICIPYERKAHNTSNYSLFQTVDSLSCSMSIQTNQALLLDPPKFPHENYLWVIFAFFSSTTNTLHCFFIFFSFENIFTINGQF